MFLLAYCLLVWFVIFNLYLLSLSFMVVYQGSMQVDNEGPVSTLAPDHSS